MSSDSKILFKSLLLTWCFSWSPDASISLLLCARGSGWPICDLICVIYSGWLLIPITCSWINSEVNLESSLISSAVSVCKTILSAYYESVTILRESAKSNNTIRTHITLMVELTRKVPEPLYLLFFWPITRFSWFICITIKCRDSRNCNPFIIWGRSQLVLYINCSCLHTHPPTPNYCRLFASIHFCP